MNGSMVQYPVAVALTTTVMLAPPATPQVLRSERPHLEAALAAARWIDAHAVRTDHGITWPAEPPQQRVERMLYNGTPGVILFYLELHRATGDDDSAVASSG